MTLRASARDATGAPAPLVLCWNENPYGPGPAARQAAADSVADACRYPSETEFKALFGAIAAHEGTDARHIVVGTGSGELLRALALVYTRGGGEVIAASPTYLELPDYAAMLGAEVKFVPVNEHLAHDLPAMRAAVTARTRLVYLCNPNNPTGTTVGATDIRDFMASLPPGVMTVVDEAYMDFAVGPDVRSVAGLVDVTPNLVVLRTFSKIHGMAGMRLGYAIAQPQVAKVLAAACMTYPNIFAVRAGTASLGDTAFLADTRRRILASRTRITTQLTAMNLKYAQPQGNFVFFDTGIPLADFTQRMQAQNILVGRLFPPFATWCRITIGTEPEVSAFLAALPGAVRA